MAIERFTGEYLGLSNFGPGEVNINGIVYLFRENAFQAQKTLDVPMRRRIAEMSSPGEAKRAGRRLVLRADWNQVRKRVMLGVVLSAFTQHESLAALLVSTGDEQLIEGNTWHDNYWGSCMCDRCARSYAHSGLADIYWAHRGHNYLGRLLMATRDVIRIDEEGG